MIIIATTLTTLVTTITILLSNLSLLRAFLDITTINLTPKYGGWRLKSWTC